jgi:hypothetical protein
MYNKILCYWTWGKARSLSHLDATCPTVGMTNVITVLYVLHSVFYLLKLGDNYVQYSVFHLL